MPVNALGGRLLALPRSAKRLLALSVDAALCALSVWLAFGLRLDHWAPLVGVRFIPVVVSWMLALPLFIGAGMYRVIFRYSGWRALGTVGKALIVYTLLFSALFSVYRVDGVPRTLGLIQPLLLILLVSGSRVFASYWLGGLNFNRADQAATSLVLIYGAGSAGRQIAAVLANTRQMKAVGFVDDKELHAGHQQLAALEMVEQAARRGDQHVSALVENLFLGTKGHATDQQGHGKPLALGIGLEVFGDLGGQFARRCDDQRSRHAGLGPAARQAFDQGQGKGGRLASARLGDAKDVAPGESGRDRTGLDRGRFGIASRFDGFEKFGAQSEIGERHGVL